MNDATLTGHLRERRPPATALYVSVPDQNHAAVVQLSTDRGGDA